MQPFFWHLTLLKGTLSVILLTILSLPFIPRKNYGNSNFIIIVIPQKNHISTVQKNSRHFIWPTQQNSSTFEFSST